MAQDTTVIVPAGIITELSNGATNGATTLQMQQGDKPVLLVVKAARTTPVISDFDTPDAVLSYLDGWDGKTLAALWPGKTSPAYVYALSVSQAKVKVSFA